MPKEFNVARFSELIQEARSAFLLDSAYAIAIARPAGALAARRREKESLVDLTLSDV